MKEGAAGARAGGQVRVCATGPNGVRPGGAAGGVVAGRAQWPDAATAGACGGAALDVFIDVIIAVLRVGMANAGATASSFFLVATVSATTRTVAGRFFFLLVRVKSQA